jgi:hypothetical protein
LSAASQRGELRAAENFCQLAVTAFGQVQHTTSKPKTGRQSGQYSISASTPPAEALITTAHAL